MFAKFTKVNLHQVLRLLHGLKLLLKLNTWTHVLPGLHLNPLIVEGLIELLEFALACSEK